MNVHLWDARSHKLFGEPLKEHFNWVRSVCFLPDSRWLVSGSSDESVHVWDCQTGQPAGSLLLEHMGYVWSACTDGGLIISGSVDKMIRIWDLSTCTQIGSPINTSGRVFAIALSNNGRITAGVDQNVCVWDVKKLCLALMKGHTGSVCAVAFSTVGLLQEVLIRAFDCGTCTLTHRLGNSMVMQGKYCQLPFLVMNDGLHLDASIKLSVSVSHSVSHTPRACAITLCHPSPPTAPACSSAITHHSLPLAITPRAHIVTRALPVTPRHTLRPLTTPDPLRCTHVCIPPDHYLFVYQIVSMYFPSIPAYFSYHSP